MAEVGEPVRVDYVHLEFRNLVFLGLSSVQLPDPQFTWIGGESSGTEVDTLFFLLLTYLLGMNSRLMMNKPSMRYLRNTS